MSEGRKPGRPSLPDDEKTVSIGISAKPSWWDMVNREAAEADLPTSTFIRRAVNFYIRERKKLRERGDDPALWF
jgi:hypothetical protein